jgi:hypothetical protein
MVGRESTSACPFPALLAIYVGITAVSATLMSTVPRLANVGMPVLGPLLAAGFFGVAVEMLSRKSTLCPWLEYDRSRRVIMDLLLFVIAVLVVFPAVSPSRDIPWIFRVPFFLFLVAGIALLRIHKRVDHSEFEETGVPKALVLASRSPLYLLGVIAAFLVAMAVLNVVSVSFGLLRGGH